MTIREYIEKVEAIRKIEFISRVELARELNIAYSTLLRIQSNPDLCRLTTVKKVKKFVDAWELKNPRLE